MCLARLIRLYGHHWEVAITVTTKEHLSTPTWLMTSCMSPSAAPPTPTGVLHSTAQGRMHALPFALLDTGQHAPQSTMQKGWETAGNTRGACSGAAHGRYSSQPASTMCTQLFRSRVTSVLMSSSALHAARSQQQIITAAGQHPRQQVEGRVVKDGGGHGRGSMQSNACGLTHSQCWHCSAAHAVLPGGSSSSRIRSMKKPLPSRSAEDTAERLLPGASSWRAARRSCGVHARRCSERGWGGHARAERHGRVMLRSPARWLVGNSNSGGRVVRRCRGAAEAHP